MALSIRRAPRTSVRSRQNLALILPLLFLVVFRLATRPPASEQWSEVLMDAGGMLLLVAGLVIRVLARQWKAERAHDGLVTDGLYGYLRHPLYLGSFLLGFGLMLVVGDWLLLSAFLVLFAVNHGTVVRNEERDLEQTFGQTYQRYRDAVPALLPRFRHPALRITPHRLREALVRECDALCIWLALPLVVQLFEWSLHRHGRPGGAGLYPLVLLATIAALAFVWVRLKQEYTGLIRRERARA